MTQAAGAEVAAADGTWSGEMESSGKEHRAAGGLLGNRDGFAAAAGDATTGASAGAAAARAAGSAAPSAKPSVPEKTAVAGSTVEGSAAPKVGHQRGI